MTNFNINDKVKLPTFGGVEATIVEGPLETGKGIKWRVTIGEDEGTIDVTEAEMVPVNDDGEEMATADVTESAEEVGAEAPGKTAVPEKVAHNANKLAKSLNTKTGHKVEVNGVPTDLIMADAASSQIRTQIAQMVAALDPDGYATYRKMKYSTGSSPDLKTRKKAYAFLMERWLEVTYRVAGY